MSFCFRTDRGSIEHRWITYALLRDNVQHHLEGGHPSGAFAATHAAGEALGRGRVTVAAQTLRSEMLAAESRLLPLPATELAVSAQTRSVLDLTWPPPGEADTALARFRPAVYSWLSPDLKTLEQVFGNLVRGLIELTADVPSDAVVEVLDT
jgi:hypothetical protein